MIFMPTCYSKINMRESEKILNRLFSERPDIFKNEYVFIGFQNLLCETAGGPNIYRETMEEYNFHAECVFIFDWHNGRTGDTDMLPHEFAKFLEHEFGEGNIMILYNNESRVV